ncbi:MAG: ATP-binding protein, partial [Chloroflexota bacterium]
FANELLGVTENDNISQSAEAPAVKLRQFSQGRELSSDELPMQVAARTGKSQHDFELRIDRTGDITHTLIGGAVPLFDPIGQPRGVVAAFHEITERKRAEDELRRSNAELEQFAYVASHDLQEPLRAVAGMVQLLSQRYKGKLDERADEYIGHAVEASLRMQNLINDLLDYSRVSRFGKPFVPTALESCVKTALANLDAVIQENQAQITYDPLPTVQADPGQLTQVFQNLIGNAIKFRGENSPCVHINAEIFEGSWRIAISDNGIGIEPQYFERIFLVFQRLHTRREYPGTGIGLSLCKKIIERHGGQIWVESLPGQGSTFYFSLAEKKE